MELYLVFFLFAHSLQVLYAAPPVEVTPERIILLENRPLEVRCRVRIPIAYCRFLVPGILEGLSLRPGIPPHMGIQYIGAGLEKGECGMLIQSVSSKHSGVIRCSMGFSSEPTESTGNSTLIVAKPPDPPLLEVMPGSTYRDSFREGESIQARCVISNARPIANISWYLGSEPIYDDLGPAVPEEKNGLMTISQNLTRKVTYADHGKDLKCVAGHIALSQGNINHSIYKLNVRFPPKPKSQELEKFGFTIGQPGKIVVTFQANPIPDIVWKVDQDNLKQGSRDRTGRFEAGILQHKGAGIWDAVLNINQVRAEEVEKRYTLIAQNELGHESYKVAISTSPEPPADITAGAIVGIVIAVLVILLLVFILIFARATGRWCFAGGVPRPPGESLLPYRWSLSKKGDQNPKKVNSLIYKDYTLVRYEDGHKSYVSPEEKSQLLLLKKIKEDTTPVSEKRKSRLKDTDSDSDNEYEAPVTPEGSLWKKKAKSCDDFGKVLTVRPNLARNSSLPFAEFESIPGGDERINLPPYIVPVETSLTFPMTKKKKKESKKKQKGFEETIQDVEFRREETEPKKLFSIWGKGRKKSDETEEETESPEKETKRHKKRFTVPWRKSKETTEEDDKDSESPDEPENAKSPKRFSLKLSKKKRPKVEVSETDEEATTSPSDQEQREPFRRRDVFEEKLTFEVEEPKEFFPEPFQEETKPPERLSFLRIEPIKPKNKRSNRKIDMNPLKDMFSVKIGRRNQKPDEDNPTPDVSLGTEVDATSHGKGSDTESADHGSADKSSVSKLTSEKQPKKLMNGLFGSFKIGKSKDKVGDNEHVRSPPSFEITVKDQQDEVQTEGTRTEGIVYAELDMARSPGNVMRRDDDKTEYAEIIYPGSKLTTEKAMEELRKSRENLSSSRENLTEVDEAFATMTTPDGKKEAAV